MVQIEKKYKTVKEVIYSKIFSNIKNSKILCAVFSNIRKYPHLQIVRQFRNVPLRIEQFLKHQTGDGCSEVWYKKKKIKNKKK
jgi:hypothetical protein